MNKISDNYGTIQIEEGKLWGKNTQRSIHNFSIGHEKMPLELIKALIFVKKAAASVNGKNAIITKEKAEIIMTICDKLLSDANLERHFPLSVWQTGSGTQTNMNVNEIIANLANKEFPKHTIHPNDDVNASQSTNDVFPTAMHLSSVLLIEENLLPKMEEFKNTLSHMTSLYADVYKLGRTHMQDATPLTFAQELSAWEHMLKMNISQIEDSLNYLKSLPIGGTAVGTGINSFATYSESMVKELSKYTKIDFSLSENLFHGMSSKDMFVFAHSALSTSASNLFKIAADVKLLSSGPRTGIAEIIIPSNEAGSSIMPGKVNPTQAEALSMVCLQVMGNNNTITLASSQGQLQLNTFMPLIAYNMIQSIKILGDSIKSFHDKSLLGMKPNIDKMKDYLDNSLMTATYLNKIFGYDLISQIVNEAHLNNKSLKEIIVEKELMSAKEFDDYFDYQEMIKPQELKK